MYKIYCDRPETKRISVWSNDTKLAPGSTALLDCVDYNSCVVTTCTCFSLEVVTISLVVNKLYQ